MLAASGDAAKFDCKKKWPSWAVVLADAMKLRPKGGLRHVDLVVPSGPSAGYKRALAAYAANGIPLVAALDCTANLVAVHRAPATAYSPRIRTA